MPSPVPPAPEFGAPIPSPRPSPDTLALLAHRRSATPQLLKPPAPSGSELDDLLRVSARVPDHGKLFPWRFVILEGEAKTAFADRLEPLAADQPDPGKAVATLAKLRNPPLTVAVVSRVTECNIPEWEQIHSAGAVCMTMLIAAEAMGYGANWITDWYSYHPRGRELLGLEPNERVAGFIHIGTPGAPALERVRPEMDKLTSRWVVPA